MIPFVTYIPQGQYTGIVALNYDKATDTVCGSLTVKDLKGKVITSRTLCVPIGSIRNAVLALQAAHRPPSQELAGGLYEIGGLWGDIKRKANKISKKVGARKLLKQANKLMNDPRFAQGVAALSVVYPPLGITLGQLKAANSLVTKARSGDPKAQLAIVAIAQKAKGGDPKAADAAKAILALNAAHKTGATPAQAEAQVGGWLYNRPYRGNLEAGQIGPSAGSLLRKLYHDAIRR